MTEDIRRGGTPVPAGLSPVVATGCPCLPRGQVLYVREKFFGQGTGRL
jgi:hypothetical protein